MRELFYSILGGVVVAILVWSFQKAIPWLKQKFYPSEPRIDNDKWKTTFNEKGREYHETVELRQRGARVQGTLRLQEGADEITAYNFEGTFKHLILTATYEAADPSNTERGSFTIRYIGQNIFNGYYILSSKEPDKKAPVDLFPSEYTWERM